MQRQRYIHNISNQAQVILKRLHVYNLSKLCYSARMCIWPFQASFPQHTQLLITIQELFSQQRHTHSLSKKGTKSFSRYKLQRMVQITNHIHPWDTNHFFSFQNTKYTSKYHICLLCTKCKLWLLTMTVQTQSGTNTSK